MARYFYDCEFIEDGHTIELVSIGVVSEDSRRSYYAVSSEFDPDRAVPWVQQHVLTQLPPPGHVAWRSRERIRRDLVGFLTGDGVPQLWAWYGGYDHVVLCQLWGSMTDLPRPLPRFTRDLRQLWEEVGAPPLPPEPPDAHDALADARHNLRRWEVLRPLRERARAALGLPAD